MKKLLFAGLALSMLVGCNNSQQGENSNNADTIENNVEEPKGGKGKIVFAEEVYDFGTIKEGEVVEHVFRFTNEGTEPVILAQVTASCGCTTPDYTSDPILPGKEGEIKVKFNSAGQGGVQQKIITVSSNAENAVTTVQLKGTVEK